MRKLATGRLSGAQLSARFHADGLSRKHDACPGSGPMACVIDCAPQAGDLASLVCNGDI